ncbi:hypothetical protein POTOM_028657 [Populus tomentosa]|uniref:Aspartate/glutamate/uridylate kinase domain-containing protein n=1 Tax=Populus tomentosa TaxID=118781 RepID=A0A8X8CV43_POPTO|nr:hypothetical protein POTOM_028657 [Populus tomentosa]
MSNLKVVLPVNAQVVLKTTNVDGVYDDDPRHNPSARLLENLAYHEMTSKDLSVMDMTAITLCQENNVPGRKGWHIDWRDMQLHSHKDMMITAICLLASTIAV